MDHAVESITTAIRASAAELRAEIQAAEDRAQEFARGIETNLLMAFLGPHALRTSRWGSQARPSRRGLAAD